MRRLVHNPKKFIFFSIATFILASILHNAVYALTQVEEPFFFKIAIVTALSIPVILIYSIFLKIRKDNDSSAS